MEFEGQRVGVFTNPHRFVGAHVFGLQPFYNYLEGGKTLQPSAWETCQPSFLGGSAVVYQSQAQLDG